MGIAFWVRRFLVVFAGATCVIAGAHILRGRGLDHALAQGLLWGALSATVFTAARIHQSRKGVHCALCRDTPDMQAPDRRSEA